MSHRSHPFHLFTLTALLALLIVGAAQSQPLTSTFTNPTVGFEIGVPEGWTVTSYEDENRIDVEDEAAILIVDAFDLALVPDNDPETVFAYILDGLVDAFDMTDAGIVEDQFLGDLEAIRIDFEGLIDDEPVYGTVIVTFDDAYFYYVMFAVAAELYDGYEETFLAMVDSFTLLE